MVGWTRAAIGRHPSRLSCLFPIPAHSLPELVLGWKLEHSESGSWINFSLRNCLPCPECSWFMRHCCAWVSFAEKRRLSPNACRMLPRGSGEEGGRLSSRACRGQSSTPLPSSAGAIGALFRNPFDAGLARLGGTCASAAHSRAGLLSRPSSADQQRAHPFPSVDFLLPGKRRITRPLFFSLGVKRAKQRNTTRPAQTRAKLPPSPLPPPSRRQAHTAASSSPTLAACKLRSAVSSPASVVLLWGQTVETQTSELPWAKRSLLGRFLRPSPHNCPRKCASASHPQVGPQRSARASLAPLSFLASSSLGFGGARIHALGAC